jgi:hypothetical protein
MTDKVLTDDEVDLLLNYVATLPPSVPDVRGPSNWLRPGKLLKALRRQLRRRTLDKQALEPRMPNHSQRVTARSECWANLRRYRPLKSLEFLTN